MSKYISSHHSKYNIAYHIIFCPKYRVPILGYYDKYIKKCFFKKAADINVSIENIEIMPDHIHMFIRSSPNKPISFIVKQLKGYTSYQLRNKFKSLKSYKSLWSPSYFVETIGHISEKTIKKYIDDQNKHKE